MRYRLFAAAALLLTLGACADLTSIYHNRPLTQAGILTIDAKQRNVLMTQWPIAGGSGSEWRICAEAAPDVFSALSASASLSADVKSQSGKAAAAIAEAAGTIERTQTINLLRESMYRTCERYLSGGLTKASFIVQAARDQRSMASILAIEQLTRTVRPPSTILVAPGTNATLGTGADAVATINQYSKEKADSASALADAQAKFKAAVTKGKCDSVTTAPAADATDPTLADWTSCKTAQVTQAAKQEEADAASARLDKIIDVLKTASPTSSGTTAGTSAGGGGGAAPSDVATVASAVQAIAENSSLNEPLMFCIAYLSEPPPSDARQDPTIAQNTVATCLEIIKFRAATDEQRLGKSQLDVDGQHFLFTPITQGHRDTPAQIILRTYLATADKAEAARRYALAVAAAKALSLPSTNAAIATMIATGQSDANLQRLLTQLRSKETDKAGRAALGTP